MPESRRDPIVPRTVIVAPDRALRPLDLVEESTGCAPVPCPFCEGQEKETPGEVLAIGRIGGPADSPGWRVRVVPNKYPAVDVDCDVDADADADFDQPAGPYLASPAAGVHEVVIESADHLHTLSALSSEHCGEVLWAYRQRLAYWREDPRMVFALVFKNVGAEAGASLQHVHSQLVVLPRVPDLVASELRGAERYFSDSGRCPFCDTIEREREQNKRIAWETDDFVALCPFASRFAYETWILPKRHESHFDQINRTSIDRLAPFLQQALRALESVLDPPAYNFVLHTSPFDMLENQHYHWRIEITPRTTKIAGFELGTGIHINPVPPERAAQELREHFR